MRQPMQPFATLQDKRKVNSTIRVLRDVAAGKKVSPGRLTRAQDLLADFLHEINSRRPQQPILCGGR